MRSRMPDFAHVFVPLIFPSRAHLSMRISGCARIHFARKFLRRKGTCIGGNGRSISSFAGEESELNICSNGINKAAPYIPFSGRMYGAKIRPLFGFSTANRSAEPLQVFFTKCVSLGSLLRGEFPRFGERPEFIDPLGLFLVKFTFHFKKHPPRHHVRHGCRPPQAVRPVPPSGTESRAKHV